MRRYETVIGVDTKPHRNENKGLVFLKQKILYLNVFICLAMSVLVVLRNSQV